MRAPRTIRILGGLLAVASGIALAGCATAAVPSDQNGRIAVVASTSVYGDIARAIGGDAITVRSLITDAAQDPHSFEASAQDQLAVAKADVVIENGGGYDDFVELARLRLRRPPRTDQRGEALGARPRRRGIQRARLV